MTASLWARYNRGVSENETDGALTGEIQAEIVRRDSMSSGLFANWPDVTPESERSGLVARVNTAIGMVDWQDYTEGTFAGVNAITGRTDGVVSGADWALFMPEVRKGGLSSDLNFLRAYLGLKPSNWFDAELAEALGTEVLDTEAWVKIAGRN